MKRILPLLCAAFIGLAGTAGAATYTEDFEAAFPTWESGWFGTQTNAQNYYGVGQGRGNNPDGLWIADGDGFQYNDYVQIAFNPLFGSGISSLSIDIATWISTMYLQVYDMSNAMIYNGLVTPTSGYYSDPGVYDNHSITSTNGISSFAFLFVNGQIEGNTSIDNIIINGGGQNPVPTPEPSTLILLGTGLAAAGIFRRRISGLLK